VTCACFDWLSAVPLLALLKNEALRPRHWARLMDLTGVKFELGDFTLGKLFAMVRVYFSFI
jgi:dynein heavy chain